MPHRTIMPPKFQLDQLTLTLVKVRHNSYSETDTDGRTDVKLKKKLSVVKLLKLP